MDESIPDTYSYKPETTEQVMLNSWHVFHSAEVRNAYQGEFQHDDNSRKFIDCVEETEDSPLDLRTCKLPLLNVKDHRLQVRYTNKNKKEVISIAELLENFCYDESFNRNLSKYESSDYEETQEHIVATDYSIHQRRYSEMKYKADCNSQDYWTVGTNTNSSSWVENSTQTQTRETKDASAQTDLKLEFLNFPMVKNVEKLDVKFTCSICWRLYASKSSYDRHLKTHVEITNNQEIISNVHFTTETKLQFCKKQGARKRRTQPIVIQLPSIKYQCGYCKELFKTQKEKDDHFEDCIIEPFLMTKCPECSIKFYTIDCLNEHVELVHKKHTSKSAYYCIFCNEHFDAAFTFQLHLDKHLSP